MMTDVLARSIRRAAIIACIPAIASAQSSLSSQGFGFPTGQLSSRAYGAGGALGEMDPLSPINPASISLLPTRTLFFQLEPEYRTVSSQTGTDHTTTARYPVIFGAIPVSQNWIFSLGASTLLDRTSVTSFRTTQAISSTESVAMTTNYAIDGAMSDVRLATAWTPTNWLRVGVGAHGITGHNLVTITQSFDDSLQFSAFTASRVLGFGGTALSGGVEIVTKAVRPAGSGRYGGPLSLHAEDTVLASGRVPNRFGASVAYVGIANSTIAVRTSHDNWSSLGTLGTSQLHPVDAWDSSIGADMAGPRLGDHLMFLRGGFRVRTLPFQAAGQNVSEKSITGGLGTAFAANRVVADLAVIHASRSANLSASEHAWTFSVGIAVRP